MRSVNTSVRLILLPVMMLLLAAGCAVTDRQVMANAEQMHGSLQPATIRDQRLANYLQSVGERIVAAGREADQQKKGPKQHFDKGQDDRWMYSDQMQFHLVNSKTLNAFTTGGEHMYIYNQLLQEARSEDELAAVMAHEYAHVYARHVAQGMKNQMTTLLAGALVGGAAGYALGGEDNKLAAAGTGAGLGAAGGQFVNMGFTRRDENEADQWGFYFYTRAGWDPNHFADFFQHMIDKGYDKTPGILSDHPTLASRVEATKKRVRDLPPEADRWRRRPIADAREFRDLQERAATLGKRLPDDKSLQNSQQLAQALPRSCVAPIDPPDAIQARENLAAKARANSNQAAKKKR
jgi:predicted Zn-dependent protease